MARMAGGMSIVSKVNKEDPMADEDKKYPVVEIDNIENLKVSTGKSGIKVSFEVPVTVLGPETLKLIWMSSMGQLLNVTIESPLSELDMKMTIFDIKTGQVKE